MTRGGLDHVRRKPQDCARWLSTAGVVAGVKVTVVLHDLRATTLDVCFESPAPPELSDYPAEQVRVVVRANGKVLAVPASGDDREWLHPRAGRLLDDRRLCQPVATIESGCTGTRARRSPNFWRSRSRPRCRGSSSSERSVSSTPTTLPPALAMVRRHRRVPPSRPAPPLVRGVLAPARILAGRGRTPR